MATSHSTRMNSTATSIPAVGYIRMSTDKQEDSPEQQRAEIIKLANRHGYRMIRWYEDHGISGAKTLKRPQFRQMIRDAEDRRDFRAILCWDQDRFGRFDSIEAGEWISPLRRVGVELVTVAQGRIDWDDFAGRMIYQITQEGKHRYLVDLSKNSLRGMIRFAKAGHLLGMPTPYGYERVYYDGSGKEMCRIKRRDRFHKPRDWKVKLVPSSDCREVETIQWMFCTFAETDCSARALAVELNRRKVPSPTDGEWSWTFVKKMLRHPVYLGWLTYGRRQAGLYHHVGLDGEIVQAKDRVGGNGDYAPIVVKDNHEPLVDEATFNAVQAKLATRKTQRGPSRRYLLSGLLRCGHCGDIMVGSAGSRGRSKTKQAYRYYKCKRSRECGTCGNYAVRTHVIEHALVEHFRGIWLTGEGQQALRKAIHAVARKRKDDRPDREKALRDQVAKLDRQIAQGTENLLLLAPADVPAAAKVLARWREERNQAQVDLDTLAIKKAPDDLDPDAVIAELQHLEEQLTSECIPLAKTAFRRVFKSVKLFWKQVSPRYRELERAEVETQFPFA